jgi:hypothetical protein
MDEHQDLIQEISGEYKDILANSSQAVYIFLDDDHKVCNEKFASLLDYNSPEEWAAVKENFPVAFVADQSQEILVNTYQKAMEECVGSKIKVSWKKKTGGNVDTEVILVPVSHNGHLFALHFIS